MENMQIYEAVRAVPEQAKKPIKGGRLKGMTDINPMYRIKTLTEQFGPCGIGWYTEMIERWTEQSPPTGEVIACVRLALYVKVDDMWSAPIEGEGGAMLIEKERNGMHASDEAWKMAKTDALSVCCKALGIGADVYWEKDASKYTEFEPEATLQPPPMQPEPVYTPIPQDYAPEPPQVVELYPQDDEVKPYERKTLQDLCDRFGVKLATVCKEIGWSKGQPWTRECHAQAMMYMKKVEDGRS